MPVNRPKKPKVNGGRRRPSAAIPKDVLAPTRSNSGAGVQFVDQFLSRSGSGSRLDVLGQGLPAARPPRVLEVGEENDNVDDRARDKRIANLRRSAANNVTGYSRPNAAPAAGGSPLPTAAELLRLTDDQAYPSDALQEGTYHFPQVSPTKSSNPERPRTLEAGYEAQTNGPGRGTLRVRFRDGTPWEYYDVEPAVWQRFKRSASPGKFVNRVLNDYEYSRGDF